MKKKRFLSIFLLSMFAFIAISQQIINISDSLEISASLGGHYIIKKDGVFVKIPTSGTRYGVLVKLDCDMPSFEILKNGYAKDKKYVYCYEKIIKNADPKTFKIFSEIYAKDSNSIFCRGKLIEKADPGSFKIIKKRFAIDKHNVYYIGKIISVDPVSFQILDYKSRYAKDKEYIYYWWGLGSPRHIDTLKEVKSDSFRVLSDSYATDGEKVFLHGKILQDADPDSFKIITEKNTLYRKFSFDKKHAYYRNKIITMANPDSFELLEFYYYSKDENYVFYEESLIKGADSKSFTPLSYQWGKDKNFIFFKNTVRKDIDYKTFEVDPSNKVKGKAKDKFFIYNNSTGKIIKKNIQD